MQFCELLRVNILSDTSEKLRDGEGDTVIASGSPLIALIFGSHIGSVISVSDASQNRSEFKSPKAWAAHWSK